MAVSNLSDEERGKVRAACSALGANEPGSKYGSVIRDVHEEDERFLLFYNIFTEILREVVGTKLPKQPSYLPLRLYQSLKTGWSIADDLLDQVSPLTKIPHRIKFYRIILLTVIDHIHNLGIPVSTKTVTQQLQNCAALLHQQFPGYLQAGLMSLTLRWGQSGTNPDEEEI